MLKVSIPEPCHEDWDLMVPDNQGRHCSTCAKTVVDFTNLSDEEVKQFFVNKKAERVCGRFRNEQLHRITIELPQNIFFLPMPFWKKFLVASLLAFSAAIFSCDTIVQGKAITEPEKNEQLTGVVMMDLKKSPADTSIADSFVTKTHFNSSEILGDVSMVTMDDSVTQGIPEIQLKEEITKTEIIKLDTLCINNISDKKGEVQIIKQDSIKAKIDSKSDSINCNSDIYQ
jgi:hypothetical protein